MIKKIFFTNFIFYNPIILFYLIAYLIPAGY